MELCGPDRNKIYLNESIKPHSHLYVTDQTSPTLLRSFYRHLGFTDTDSEQITHGIRYTPMESHILR